MKLMKLMYYLVMYLHCQGCLWYYVIAQDSVWIPTLDFIYSSSTFFERGVSYRYWISVYYSCLMLTGNDLGPRNQTQIFFIAMTDTMGAIINANLFGELAVLVAAINRKSTDFQNKLDTVNTAMKNMKLEGEF